MIFAAGCALLVLAATSALGSQGSAATPGQAQAAFLAGKWDEAVAAYETLLMSDSANSVYWYRLGYACHSSGQYERAVQAYKKAIAITPAPGALYNLACSYARLHDNDEALKSLQGAAAAGFNQPATLLADDDLKPLRADARFDAILANVRTNAAPCEHDPVHRQFDFWAGEWNVFTKDGHPVGTSSVERILSGCVLLEQWTGANGSAGKSFNFVDPGTGAWRQTWVDSRGSKIEYHGGLDGASMVFIADERDANGNAFQRRLTFFNLGAAKVRQFAERSTDGGATWSVDYDFTYVRK